MRFPQVCCEDPTCQRAQELMEAPEGRQLSVHLYDPNDYAAHAVEIRSALPESVEVLGWPEPLPAIHDMVEMDTRQSQVVSDERLD